MDEITPLDAIVFKKKFTESIKILKKQKIKINSIKIKKKEPYHMEIKILVKFLKILTG